MVRFRGSRCASASKQTAIIGDWVSKPMQLANLCQFFESSPVARLLRSPNAPFIVDFLNRTFKIEANISLSHGMLVTALSTYQEELHHSHPNSLTNSPSAYLTDWCSADNSWLRRSLEADSDEPIYQLTWHSEDAFVFLNRVVGKDLRFVGTESRLKLVINTLTDLAMGSTADREARIAHLEREQRRIGEEISSLKAGEQVTTYQPAQVRERFTTAMSLLRELQSDFRAVEESFRLITVEVQQREIDGKNSRGEILEYALDAEDILKQKDQGVSFYEFVRMILSPTATEKLERIVEDVRKLPDLSSEHENLMTARTMVATLQAEAQKVMRTNQRLSATLRRLLEARSSAERKRVAQLLQEIRSHAIALAEDPPTAVRIKLDVRPQLSSPFMRPFWSAPQQFDNTIDLRDFEAKDTDREAAFRQLATLHRLDWKRMRAEIEQFIATNPAATLTELLTQRPPKGGVIEVLGYLQIARDDGHLVNSEVSEQVQVPAVDPHSQSLMVTIPLVTLTSGGPDRAN